MSLLERIFKPRSKEEVSPVPGKQETITPPSRIATLVQQATDDAANRKKEEGQRLLEEKKIAAQRETERIKQLELAYQKQIKPFHEHLEKEGIPQIVNDFIMAIAYSGDRPKLSSEVFLLNEDDLLDKDGKLKFGGPVSFLTSSQDPNTTNDLQYRKSDSYKKEQHKQMIERVSKEPIQGVGYVVYWGYKNSYTLGDEYSDSYSSDHYHSSVAIFSLKDFGISLKDGSTSIYELLVVSNGKTFTPSGGEEVIDIFANVYRQSLKQKK